MKKFIFIGLGGSGGKTLRYLRSDLRKWLDQIGWVGSTPDALPVGWQLIQIDTPSEQDGQEITEVPMLPAESYLGLVGSGITFSDVSNSLTGGGSNSNGWEDLVSWRVDPTHLKVPITMGAGQYRAVGRSIGLAYTDRIFEAICRAERNLMSTTANAELAAISKLATGQDGVVDTDPVAVVVSSLAGGSGAGLLMDTCDILRQVGGSWGDHSFGILYTSDVFTQVGDQAGGIQPNTLAALCEVLNGHWFSPTSSSPTGRISHLLANAGAALPIKRSGPAYPFLVGASNTKGITFGDQKSVYRMMGRALRSWTTDRKVQGELVAYTITNWDTVAKANVVNADVLLKHHEPVFEAYGFSEVNLGTDRFETYASERFARSAAEWLHKAHIVRARMADPNDGRPAAVLINDFADLYLQTFLRDSKINEGGPENNDVIDALMPGDNRALFDRTDSALFEAATEGVPNNGLNLDSWLTHINDFLPGFAGEFVSSQESDASSLAQKWVKEEPERALEALKTMIALNGLQVAERVLELAITTSLTTVDELMQQSAECLMLASGYRSQMASKMNGSGKFKKTHPGVADAIREGLWSFGHYGFEAQRFSLGSKLLHEFTLNFLKPLAKAVHDAYARLDIKGFEGEGNTQPLVPYWAEDAVPDRLLPPKNEQLVIPIETFKSRLESLTSASFPDEGMDDALNNVRSEIIDGRFLDKVTDATKKAAYPISVNQRWVIDPNIIGASGGIPAPATFSSAFNPEDLFDRSKAWLNHSNSFNTFLGYDLRSYLGDDPSSDPRELNDRRNNFTSALQSALDAAEPLVKINNALRTRLHPNSSQKPHARPGNIPLKDHPLEGQVKSILAGALGGATGNFDGFLSTDPRVTSIPISSTLGAAHDPLIFESISDPIISSWAKVQGTPAAMNFWSHRRARPLTEFVPVSQTLLLSMVRGWFTALMLGRIDRQNLHIQRANGDIASFPSTLLSAGIDRLGADLMPAVLESLGLAYIQLAQLNLTTPLDAYSELRDLGAEASGGKNYRTYDDYRTLNDSLLSWVETGSYGSAKNLGTPLLKSSSLTSESTPEERQEFAATVVTELIESYRDSYDEYVVALRKDSSVLGPDQCLWVGLYGGSQTKGPIQVGLNDLLNAFKGKATQSKPLA